VALVSPLAASKKEDPETKWDVLLAAEPMPVNDYQKGAELYSSNS
jgi:hypothetical protein